METQKDNSVALDKDRMNEPGYPMSEEFLDRMDAGIRRTVQILRENGIETTESCEGMPGHCYSEPTVSFNGGYEAGFRALSLCFTYGLHPDKLRRVWSITDGEVVGPEWELTFFHKDGGGLHPVEQEDGFYKFQWGPVKG